MGRDSGTIAAVTRRIYLAPVNYTSNWLSRDGTLATAFSYLAKIETPEDSSGYFRLMVPRQLGEPQWQGMRKVLG